MSQDVGKQAFDLIAELYPICRSLSGDGVRETLKILKKHVPLKVHEVKSGTKAFDWTVPDEWNIRDAYVTDSSGKKVIDFKRHNLHVVGYSTPIDIKMTLEELDAHLHSLPEQPDAIPYVTSYYKKTWGFCLSHTDRKALKKGSYHVVIDSTLKPGKLTYADCVIPGESKEEIFFSTYICHPSMVNNELSGPSMAVALAKHIAQKKRRYTYRFIFVPETIGALAYMRENLSIMKKRTVAGFVLTCLADDRTYSFLRSRNGNTYADRLARAVLSRYGKKYIEWSYLDRGSDERQYGSPIPGLPVVTMMRSRFGTYPEYHTSLDNLSITSPEALQGSFEMLSSLVELAENNKIFEATTVGEPQLGKRGLYATNQKASQTLPETRVIQDLLAYVDGTSDLIDIATAIGVRPDELYSVAARLEKEKLLRPMQSKRL